ncbi:hypothetical protein FT663_02861 [Candidozyma haemuli var. vulneris]|uniref:Golgi apparatus membrane protein TVP23 n=1 Tax=Candidozyma haemuli TaxID=45357 RepID=A0A2V1AWS1_9ASCO|nr:hypothetical protein CXQ85_005322 [[Candida] haemuloni]KAF3989583.1 hypothetical protein FT662_02753 [[Candida] haemuloni var. vulneris]KAF3991134.1 hypothetical protein FT663_02861 [[Candida] haemuloni var. vulneris]PVH22295.1 hypothetical protein CXQ85_005322 [[Candida] haemuloni]
MSGYTQIEADETVGANPYGSGNNSTVPPVSGNMAPAPAEGTGAGGEEWSWSRRLKESSHPVALMFYIVFRLSPIFTYIFGNMIISIFISQNRFILHFIVLTLLVSADFWNLKNISGRLLVGLRWWNETTKKEGSTNFENVWVFESADPERYINPIDSKVFWTLLYAQPVAWAVLAIMAVLKFELLYLVLIVISLSLSLTNAMAFTKCDKFGKANNLATDIFSRTTGGIWKRFNPFSS